MKHKRKLKDRHRSDNQAIIKAVLVILVGCGFRFDDIRKNIIIKE